MATKGKKKGSNTHPEEYTNEDIRHDLQLIAESVVTSNSAIEKRLEAMEGLVGSDEDDDWGPKDRKRALSVLADQTINPDEKMLPQMTETPDRMIMPMAVKHAQNEFLKILTQNPDTTVLFSDLLMKWIDIKMRSRKRALIGEALGFSQIETEKALDDEERKIALEE